MNSRSYIAEYAGRTPLCQVVESKQFHEAPSSSRHDRDGQGGCDTRVVRDSYQDTSVGGMT